MFVLRSNPYTDQTNPPDVVMVRDAGGWSQVAVPDAPDGLGDFVMWLNGPQAWLVGNGLEDTLGTLTLVRPSATNAVDPPASIDTVPR